MACCVSWCTAVGSSASKSASSRCSLGNMRRLGHGGGRIQQARDRTPDVKHATVIQEGPCDLSQRPFACCRACIGVRRVHICIRCLCECPFAVKTNELKQRWQAGSIQHHRAAGDNLWSVRLRRPIRHRPCGYVFVGSLIRSACHGEEWLASPFECVHTDSVVRRVRANRPRIMGRGTPLRASFNVGLCFA